MATISILDAIFPGWEELAKKAIRRRNAPKKNARREAPGITDVKPA
ncbi:hypothetical protein [Mesorhizobium sp. B2-4-17]|nr:hypothetical protein [Mesorhizobium sp. B2-4-17]